MATKKNIKATEALFAFKSIELLQCSMLFPTQNNAQISNFTFDLVIENQVDASQNLVFIICKIRINCNDNNENIGAIDVSCIYEIQNFKEVIQLIPEGKWILPKTLSDVLNSISISTTRGIMFSTFKGTFLHNAILPIIDPSALKSKE